MNYIITDNDDEIVHRHQNRELLFYQQVASGDMEAIHENCLKHEFLNQAGVGCQSQNAVLSILQIEYKLRLSLFAVF